MYDQYNSTKYSDAAVQTELHPNNTNAIKGCIYSQAKTKKCSHQVVSKMHSRCVHTSVI